MNIGTRLTLLFIVSLLFGCSGRTGNTATETLGGQKYIVVTPGDLAKSDANLTGTGSIVFNTPLSETASKNSYRLFFTLQDGGDLSLIANSTNKLQSGVSVKFSRNGAVLKVELLAVDKTTDVSAQFATLNAADKLGFQIDVHNDESPAHILVWSTNTTFEDSTALLNSEGAGLEAPGQGAGAFWGVSLTKASLTEAVPSAAKFSEN